VLAACAVLAAASCGRRAPPVARPMLLAVEVAADSGRSQTLHVEPPRRIHVWMRRVTPTPPPSIDAPLPFATSEPPPPDTLEAPALEIDAGLKPPLLRTPARLVMPSSYHPGAEARPEPVELDVRVDESGDVTEARWAGGSADTSLVSAAVACARRMRFFPARMAGRPVAVWCRQRFDFEVQSE
jgi:TonB family protein